MRSTLWVWVTFRSARWHRWPDAHHRRKYLAHPHRHLFHVKVELQVSKLDRQVEFHDLLEKAEEAFEDHVTRVSTLSCEQMARAVIAGLRPLYRQPLRVTVSEDGECGATMEDMGDAVSDQQDVSVQCEPPT